MRNRTAGFVPSFLLGLLSVGARPAVSGAEEPPNSLVAEAQAFASDLAAGEFHDAAGRFDPTMAAAIPADKLRDLWGQLEKQSGPFQSFGSSTTGEVSGLKVVYVPARFKAGALRLKIVFDRQAKITGLWFEPTDAAAGPSYQPPPYDNPERYYEQDVEFGDETWRVKGKLTTPRTRALAPVVVLVHGSGPHDEDESIGPNKPFRDLATGLSSNGIAVLRYQKRTFAYRLRLAAVGTITVREEVIDDALAAVDFLRTQSSVDRSRIYVLGHSLGASLAPQIASEAKDLAGVILLSGTPRDFCDVLIQQLDYIAGLKAPNQEANRKIAVETKALIAKFREGKVGQDEMLLGVPLSYWTELSEAVGRSLKLADSATCRMLIAGGGRDYQVTRKDFDAYRKALGARNNVTYKWFKAVNHLFTRGEKMGTPDEYGRAGHVDPEVIEYLTQWIRDR